MRSPVVNSAPTARRRGFRVRTSSERAVIGPCSPPRPSTRSSTSSSSTSGITTDAPPSTAPFAAPLSYAGLGFLLLLNRTESPHSAGYGQWVTLLAAGGFAGNFALTLADHAQNGFFHASEWLAVLAAAFGLIGSGLHISAILAGPKATVHALTSSFI